MKRSSVTDKMQMEKALALGALRRGDRASASEHITTARCLGADRREIACLFSIDWEQPDAVLQREIAKVLAGTRDAVPPLT
jgi:hypothetical protein